jgi:hypothetical protein
LTKAIKRKLAKSEAYSQEVDILLVHAEQLHINTIDEKTEEVVLPAIQALRRGTRSSNPSPSSGESANYRFPEHEELRR